MLKLYALILLFIAQIVFFFGILGPFLFSAPSTIAVLLGFAVLTASMISLYVNIEAIINQIKKVFPNA